MLPRFCLYFLLLALLLQLMNEYLALFTSYSQLSILSLSSSASVFSLFNGPYIPPWRITPLKSSDEATEFVEGEFSGIYQVFLAQIEKTRQLEEDLLAHTLALNNCSILLTVQEEVHLHLRIGIRENTERIIRLEKEYGGKNRDDNIEPVYGGRQKWNNAANK